MTARVSLEEIIARGSWGLAEVYINEGEGVVKTASVRPTHETCGKRARQKPVAVLQSCNTWKRVLGNHLAYRYRTSNLKDILLVFVVVKYALRYAPNLFLPIGKTLPGSILFYEDCILTFHLP